MKFVAISLMVLVCSVFSASAGTIYCGDRKVNHQQQTGSAAESNQKSNDASDLPATTTTTTTPAAPTTEPSEVKQFFNRVQCTLERARPWVEELEKEAKRLEQTVIHIGEGVLNTVNTLVKGLMVKSDDTKTSASSSSNSETGTKSIFSILLRGVLPNRINRTTPSPTVEPSLSESGNENSAPEFSANTPTPESPVTSSSSSSSTADLSPASSTSGPRVPFDDDVEFIDNEI